MKQRIKNLAAAVIFLFLAFEVFLHCTYLFRNTERAARQNILGYYAEKDDSLDVVFVGPSSVYRYWSPMRAWDSYGFTSYDYSVSAMSRATILTAIKDLRRSQTPAVIVVDVRPFINVNEINKLDSPERNMLDSIDVGPVRLQGVKYLSDHSGISGQEIGSAYMELAQYHNNKAALAEELNWQLIDNRLNGSADGGEFYKGFAIAAKHTYLSEDMIHLSEGIADEVSEYYMDILEYGKKNNLTFLFVASPKSISEKQSEILNRMRLAAKEYGYGFIDGHCFYKEMNLDFTTDFYNSGHVNILGAEKWTEFVGEYLVREFDLPDHRKDPEYDAWNAVCEQYKAAADSAADETLNLIRDHEASLKNEEIMRGTEDFATWFHLANDNNISILVSVDSCSEYVISDDNAEMLKWLGIDEACMGSEKQYYALYCNRMIYKSTFDPWLEGTVGGLELPFTMKKEGVTKLVIDKEEWQISQGSICMIAVDNNLNQAVDFVKLQVDEAGGVKLRHLAYQ